jgi:aldehyde:ferredoxin oxidoreductase
MVGGYMGKMPWVNLTTGETEIMDIDDSMWRTWIGGYGIGARLIYERQKPGTDPLGPDNILGMVAGPLAGTPAICSGRFTVMGKSPLTGGWGDANSGGYFGPYMKFAGIDGIFFEGAAEKPVYVYVENGNVEIRDASHLWGLDCIETEDALLAEHGKNAAVACIGPSGEKLSLISCVINDRGRAAGRSGVGAIMGSKKLKAVVVNGKQRVPIADPVLMKETVKNLMAEMRVNDWFKTAHKYGTPGITSDSIVSGDGPILNWGGAYPKDFPDETSLSGDNVIKYQYKKYACWGCPIACGGWVKVEGGPFAVEGHKPEYETLGAFGFMCKNDNVESICKANEICNIYGLDTISAGATVTFAIECYENGILTKADTGGLELNWGNADSIVKLTEMIAKREGIGDVLADGVKKASESIGRGSEQYAMHVGGQELPMHDGKLAPGVALTYQYDATPARHCQGCEDWPQPNLPVQSREMTDYSGRGADHMKQAAHMHIQNSAGICQFGASAYDAVGVPDQIKAVTGWDYTMDDVFLDGERIHTLRHLFNLREGINPRNIKTPGRALGRPPLDHGALKGVTVDLEQMAKDFYAHAGWDLKTSMPSKETLERLGLTELVKNYG